MITDSEGVSWWTAREVAEFWGIAPTTVRNTMIRHKVAPHRSLFGPRGALFYPTEQVKQAKEHAPGPGNRTNHPRRNS